MINRFQAVLCDMDGTLVDSEKLWHMAEQRLIEMQGKIVKPEIQKNFTGMDTPSMIRTMRKCYGLEASEETLTNQLRQMVKDLLKNVETCQGAAELLEFLKTKFIPCALVSNSSMDIIETSLSHQPWQDVLVGRFSADHVSRAKPAPDLYLYAAKELGIKPQDCLVLEDSLTGVRAAASAGMTCCAIPNEDDANLTAFKTLTPYVFGDLFEVMAWLETGNLP